MLQGLERGMGQNGVLGSRDGDEVSGSNGLTLVSGVVLVPAVLTRV